MSTPSVHFSPCYIKDVELASEISTINKKIAELSKKIKVLADLKKKEGVSKDKKLFLDSLNLINRKKQFQCIRAKAIQQRTANRAIWHDEIKHSLPENTFANLSNNEDKCVAEYSAEFVDESIRTYNEGEKKELERLETIRKVIKVVSFLVGFCFPISLMYAPAWATFGIMLPVFIGLQVVESFSFKLFCINWKSLDERIPPLQQKGSYLHLLRKAVSEKGLRGLHPYGDWDLEMDEDLKSDKMMREEFGKNEAQCAKDYERIVAARTQFYSPLGDGRDFSKHDTYSVVDLAVNSFVRVHAVRQLSQFSQVNAAWKREKENVKSAKQFYLENAKNAVTFSNYDRRNDLLEFQNEMAAVSRAVSYIGGTPPKPFNLPLPNKKEEVYQAVRQFAYLCQRHKKLIERYLEAAKLYEKVPSFDKDLLGIDWPSYLSYIDKLSVAFQPVLTLFEPAQSGKIDWNKVFEKMVADNLVSQMRDVMCISIPAFRDYFKARIQQHPKTILDSLEQKFKEYREFYLLSEACQSELSNFIQFEIPMNKESKKQLDTWFDKHNELKGEKLHYVLQRVTQMKKRIEEAEAKLTPIKERYSQVEKDMNAGIFSEEAFKKVGEELDVYQETILPKMEEYVADLGFENVFKRIAVAVTRRRPAPPVPTIPSKDSYMRQKTIELLRVRKLLQDVNLTMLRVNFFGRAFGVHLVLSILVLAEVIIFHYVSGSTWMLLGFMVTTGVLDGLAVLLVERIKKMDEEKQTHKYYTFLYDRPDIVHIPGTAVSLNETASEKLDLEELAAVQKKYGLEKPHALWARALQEGTTPFREIKARKSKQLESVSKKPSEEKIWTQRVADEGNYRYLSQVEKRIESLKLKIQEYKKDPQKTDLLKRAEDQLHYLQKRFGTEEILSQKIRDLELQVNKAKAELESLGWKFPKVPPMTSSLA